MLGDRWFGVRRSSGRMLRRSNVTIRLSAVLDLSSSSTLIMRCWFQAKRWFCLVLPRFFCQVPLVTMHNRSLFVVQT